MATEVDLALSSDFAAARRHLSSLEPWCRKKLFETSDTVQINLGYALVEFVLVILTIWESYQCGTTSWLVFVLC
jgi:hypothetical protein